MPCCNLHCKSVTWSDLPFPHQICAILVNPNFQTPIQFSMMSKFHLWRESQAHVRRNRLQLHRSQDNLASPAPVVIAEVPSTPGILGRLLVFRSALCCSIAFAFSRLPGLALSIVFIGTLSRAFSVVVTLFIP